VTFPREIEFRLDRVSPYRVHRPPLFMRRLLNPPRASAEVLTVGLPRWKTKAIILIMKFRLLVEFDPEAKRWSAVFPEIPGCATAGDTEAEAVTNATEALALWFEPTPVKLPKGAKMIELAVP
jgi:predicted RNase H-like HicB family nuclease